MYTSKGAHRNLFPEGGGGKQAGTGENCLIFSAPKARMKVFAICFDFLDYMKFQGGGDNCPRLPPPSGRPCVHVWVGHDRRNYVYDVKDLHESTIFSSGTYVRTKILRLRLLPFSQMK